MPATVNGIGTHYYGKSNKTTRTGVCQACGAACRLDSYDTRLWFVVFYIPIIPLGRKQITDQCSCCHQHWITGKNAYEASKREHITAAMELYERQPSPESALELHGSMLAFHHYDKAKEFRELAMERHRESDELLNGLAAQMDEVGREDDSKLFYEKAFAMRPDLSEIGMGVADARIADGKLDEARRLLKPQETPGAALSYSLERLDSLAYAYQRAGRHAETLEICKHLLAELPSIGEIHGFRQLVTASEKALGRPESLLPKKSSSGRGLFGGLIGSQSGWRRKLAIGVAVLVIATVALVASNEYFRHHRPVFVLNDTGQAVEVTIDDQTPIKVGRLKRLELSEGRRHVKLSGPVNDEFDVELQTDYFSRWTKSPVWVISADGGSALLVNTIHYAVNPRPTQTQLVIVDGVFHLPHVDYAFTNPPHEIQVDNDRTEKKIHLERVNAPAADIFQAALHRGDPAAWKYAETYLRRNPANSQLLTAYELAAMTAGQTERARQFLKAGLVERPISVVWHRAYQDLGRNTEREAELIAEYDELLEKEPDSAELLYLRGRIDVDTAKGQEFFRRSCEADANLPWPWMALAYDAATRGDWEQARELADRAFNLHLDYPGLNQIRFAARLATGDAEAMERERRQAIKSGPPGSNMGQLIELCEVLVAQGKTDEARQVMHQWEKQLPPELRKRWFSLPAWQYVWYMVGDPVTVQSCESPHNDSFSANFRLHSLLARGDLQEALKDPGLQQLLEEPWSALAVSVAFSLAANPTEADAWREKACAALEKLDANSRHAAVVLRGAKPPSKKQIDDIALYPSVKSLLLAALAVRFPEQKSELVPLARRLNVRRMPPYQLVRKVTDD